MLCVVLKYEVTNIEVIDLEDKRSFQHFSLFELFNVGYII